MAMPLTCGNAAGVPFRILTPSVRDEEAAGSNPATPTMKLQVAVLFRDEFRIPIPAAIRFWERTAADLVQPTSLTSDNVPLFVRRVGAAASERRIRACGAVNPWPHWICGHVASACADSSHWHSDGTMKLTPNLAAPPVTRRGRHCPPPLMCRIRRSKRLRNARHLSIALRDRSGSESSDTPG
jgi:hypothetical protein